jgi:hypothetical protein
VAAQLPFHWNEDFDESVNYCFWSRRRRNLDDAALLARVRTTLGHRSPVEAHAAIRQERDFDEYLVEWRAWKLDQIRRQRSESRQTPPGELGKHYSAVAALGLGPLTVYWVMAPFGERWLVPPSVVILGADGGTAAERRQAVLAVAEALRQAR